MTQAQGSTGRERQRWTSVPRAAAFLPLPESTPLPSGQLALLTAPPENQGFVETQANLRPLSQPLGALSNPDLEDRSSDTPGMTT